MILKVVNQSLQEGRVAEEWKNSIITPILNIIGSNKAEEHRPINTLPLYEKILEQAVKKRIMKYIGEEKILIPEQLGFRKGFSCETALQDSY